MSWHPPEEVKNSLPARRIPNIDDRKRTKQTDRRIAHIDMDAFFAAVEQRDNPALRGKPVIVGGKAGERGVVSTCSYEAREYGVRSGMSLTEAQRLCPHGEYVRTHGKKYTYTAVQLIGIYHKYTPVVEPVSIDEAYLDITGCSKIYESEEKFGKTIKKEIENRTGLTGTVGIAHNRIYAKLATGMEKPDGLTIINKRKIPDRVYPLPVEKLWGIGASTQKTLNKLKIITIGDLANCPVNILKKYFGINGEHLSLVAKGESSSEIINNDNREDEKSVGNERTFAVDETNIDIIMKWLMKLSQKVGRRLRKAGFGGKTVTFKLRYSDFETLTHRETFPGLMWDDKEIYNAGKMLFEQVYKTGRPVRLIGISVSKLIRLVFSDNNLIHQGDLFESENKKRKVTPVMDKLRDKYGEKIISRFSGLT
ncbi:DNA polymerase IV [candidate division KSB1 bacterium]